jgi:hypothetical protein
MITRFRFRIQKSPRLARCGRGCRRPDLDEMIHAYPEKLSSSAPRIPWQKRRRAA